VKYCDEYVRLWICLSVRDDISETTRAIFTNFLCVLPMSVARSSSATFTISSIAYRREGFSSPLTLHIFPEPKARSLPIFVHVAYVHGSVLLHVYDRPHRLSPARDYLHALSAGKMHGNAQRWRSMLSTIALFYFSTRSVFSID